MPTSVFLTASSILSASMLHRANRKWLAYILQPQAAITSLDSLTCYACEMLHINHNLKLYKRNKFYILN